MVRRYDLLAISLLIFSTVLVTAISMDPKGFALSTWQPLMAAIIALGGAGIIYRGATLSYDAALKKVDLDRQIHQQEVRRRVRGVYLRTSYAMHLLCENSAHKRATLSQPAPGEPWSIDPASLSFNEEHSFDEAWNNLELFPGIEAFELRKLKVAMLNYRTSVSALGEPTPFGQTISLSPGHADEIEDRLVVIEQIAKSILLGLERHYLAAEDR